MDEATEPLIAVIGHPIAGHPAQFALERAFEHLDLDYRVASFDVAPDRLATAVDGIEVLRFRGAYLDDSVRPALADWHAKSTTVTHATDQEPASNDLPAANNLDAPPDQQDNSATDFHWLSNAYDCLSRSHHSDATMEHSVLTPSVQERQSAIGRIQAYAQQRECPLASILVLGERSARSDFPPALDRIAAADLIVIPNIDDGASLPFSGSDRARSSKNSRTERRPLNLEEWPDGDRMVIDLRKMADSVANEAAHQVLLDRGYTVLTARQIFIAGLVGCIQRWTGRDVADEVLADAIEEYTAV